MGITITEIYPNFGGQAPEGCPAAICRRRSLDLSVASPQNALLPWNHQQQITTMIAATTISRMASSQAPKVLRLRLAGNTTSQVKNNNYMKRYFSDKTKEAANTTAKESASSTTATTAAKEEAKKTTWWNNTAWWGTAGAMAGWGMSGAAIYDALESSPELISLNMTGVLLVYSSLFARWAFVVKPQNLLLAGCHITNVGAQMNQLRRAVEYKKENGKDDEVDDIMKKA
eukprot:scaffold16799_cov67-Skeletonema_dohrnii-CCMP3373.AAC.1